MAILSVGSTPLARPTPRLIRLVRSNERLFYGILGFVVVGLLWEAAGDLGLYRKSLLSTPSLVLTAAIQDFGSGAIFPDLRESFVEFSLGFFSALGIGIPLGLLIGTNTAGQASMAREFLLKTGQRLRLAIAPVNTVVLDASEEDDRATMAALLTVIRLVGALVGVALLTTRGLSGFYASAGQVDITDPNFIDRVIGLEVDSFRSGILVTSAVCFLALIPAWWLRLERKEVAP